MAGLFSKIPKNILFLAFLLAFLNLFDAGATTFLVIRVIGYELNPLMAWLIEQGIGWFIGFKVAASVFVVWGITKVKNYTAIKIALIVTLIPYIFLFIYYVIGFIWILFM